MFKQKYVSQIWALTFLVATYFTASIIEHGSLFNKVHANELNQKLMMGYQGWFLTPRDGSAPGQWRHWFKSYTDPSADELGIDMWPDMSEYTQTYDTSMTYPSGYNAALFSSYDLSTTRVHFKWMRNYNIHGVYLQRFLGPLKDNRFFTTRNTVLENVQTAAAEYQRKFAIMYDISGVADDGDLLNKLRKDWEFLTNSYDLENDASYAKQDNKLVVAIWGIGFANRGLKPSTFMAILDYFHSQGVYVIGGVPSRWRELTKDADPDPEWQGVYQALDMISPWTVGRYGSDGVDDWKTTKIIPDLAETNAKGIDYMPVIWPGFSWLNIHEGTLNQHPRNGGEFYWDQAYNAIDAGAKFIYVAMFDEVDEGTAMFKIAANKNAVPVEVSDILVTLDQDGLQLPSDWYLKLADQTQKMLDGSIPLSATIPISPQEENKAPVLELGEDFEVNIGQTVNLIAQVSDDVNDIFTYKWLQESGSAVTLANPDQTSTSFIAPSSADTLVFSFTVIDNKGTQNSDRVIISVLAPTPEPTLDPVSEPTPSDSSSGGSSSWSLLILVMLALRKWNNTVF